MNICILWNSCLQPGWTPWPSEPGGHNYRDGREKSSCTLAPETFSLKVEPQFCLGLESATWSSSEMTLYWEVRTFFDSKSPSFPPYCHYFYFLLLSCQCYCQYHLWLFLQYHFLWLWQFQFLSNFHLKRTQKRLLKYPFVPSCQPHPCKELNLEGKIFK